jgi:hypothetical protein
VRLVNLVCIHIASPLSATDVRDQGHFIMNRYDLFMVRSCSPRLTWSQFSGTDLTGYLDESSNMSFEVLAKREQVGNWEERGYSTSIYG